MKHEARFILYHRTNVDKARAIVEGGFINKREYFLNNCTWTGVWFSSNPHTTETSPETDALLVVKLDLLERDLSYWEWTGEGRSHREWLIPAQIVITRGTVEFFGCQSENPSLKSDWSGRKGEAVC
jgi:hypothetical protein